MGEPLTPELAVFYCWAAAFLLLVLDVFFFLDHAHWLGWSCWRWKPIMRRGWKMLVGQPKKPSWFIRWGGWHIMLSMR